MAKQDFVQTSIDNLTLLVAELEAETMNNGIFWNWHEDPIEPGS